jgi:bifunctional enzyme CysN/CysC
VDGAFDPALLTDGLRAEREQGITIDVAYRYFSTDKRKFIIADTPGHEQYTRNMATGASNCELAVILIDARHGVLPQTKRHSFITSLLGIRHLVVAINKMDLVEYSEERFEQIREDYMGFAAKLEVGDIHFIPISALQGDNVVSNGDHMPWFKGEPLLTYLESVQVASDRNLIDLRFPVQYVLRPHLDFRGYCGTVASGVIRKGDEVMVLPSGLKSRVKSIATFDGEQEQAFPPMAVCVVLEDDLDISRGNMLVHLHNVPRVGNAFDAMLVWMHEDALQPDRTYILKTTTNYVPAEIERIGYQVDINTMHRKASETLQLNEIGRVVVHAHRPVFYDSYGRNRHTGAFILIDRISNATLAAGMMMDREPNPLIVEQPRRRQTQSRNIETHRSDITLQERAQRLGQKAFTLWLTGLPAAGKSTIAYALEKKLFEMGCVPHVLDGENMRSAISRDLGFSGDDRSENIRRAADIARICNDAGLITIAAFVSPYEEDRKRARENIGPDRFVEVYVSTPLEVCERRDTKGLYTRARTGEIDTFSGVSAPYEPSDAPDISFSTEHHTVEDCVQMLLNHLGHRRLLETDQP